MRIAILGSVALPVPPVFQGGTEWVAFHQAKGLADLGHEVMLFAAQGSAKGKYQLIEIGYGDRREDLEVRSFIESSRLLRKENIHLAQVITELIRRKNDYDVILNNMRGEAVFLPIAKLLDKPFVNVMHLPVFAQLAGIFRSYNTPIITISNAQRLEFPDLYYLATVYNCVDTKSYAFQDKSGDYLLMMGTIGRHKNQGSAVAVAKKLGMKLVLAGKIRDNDYFQELKKDIDGKQIIWSGELDFESKLRLYQNAKAFIFPILWPEPFGLVMIEAMACGTPVVAFGNGAIPEVVRDGVTGFVIEDNIKHITYNIKQETNTSNQLIIKTAGEEGLEEAVKRINNMSEENYQVLRQNCRKHAEDNFTIEKMVKAYEAALLQIT